MWNMVRGFGLAAGLAVVFGPGCGSNAAITYGVDGNVIDDAGPDTNGVHIISPDSGHHSSGSSTSYGQPDTGTTTTNPDTGTTTNPDTGIIGQPDTSPGQTCATTCTTNAECQSSCPAAPTGSINCCDTATSACFQSATSACPGSTPTHDSGSDVY